DHLDTHDRLELVKEDLRYSDMVSLLDDVSAVIHLAGLSNDPTADFAPDLNNESNVQATRQLARAVAEKAQREKREIRFLFASSCSIYYTPSVSEDVNIERMTENLPIAPTANYSKTKRLAEIELLQIAEQYPLFCPTMLRKATIFGLSPRMRFDLVVNAFVLQAWRNQLIPIWGSGEVWRPFLHIRDAVDAYIHLLYVPTEKIRGEAFNLVHKNYRILELAHWITEILEQHRGVEAYVKRDRSKGEFRRSYYVDGDKVTKALGFRPERGVAQAALEIYDALERGDFGSEPESDSRYFNIRWLKETMAKEGAL
ncbi:MAG: SDR family oxidoreductase, partial [Actinobacteria bacterium]|nr:SDR family oxidoreductase [Actinomycetota bacterium]